MGRSIIAKCLKCKYETEVFEGGGKSRNGPFYWVVLNRKNNEVEGISFPVYTREPEMKVLNDITNDKILSSIMYDKDIYCFYRLDSSLSPEPCLIYKFLYRFHFLKNINYHFCPKCKSYRMILKDGDIFFD